jgi:outer membrane protein TolC
MVLAGCQSYEPVPLDVPSHRAAMRARLEQPEPVAAFTARLAERAGEAPTEFSLADGLSVAEGEVLALFYNPDLRLARLEAGVALATAEHAGLWKDPEFGFDGAEILSPGGPFEYGLTLGLTIPISGRLSIEKARAKAAYEAELRRIVDMEWSTRARVRYAWAAWTVAEERARLLSGTLERSRELGGIVDSLASVGEISRIEARTLSTALTRTRADLAEARMLAMRGRLELLALMGVSTEAAIELLPSVFGHAIPDVADPVRRLIEANTTLAVKRAEYQTAEESLRLEVREQYPDITIGGGYGREGDDRLLLGLSLPIPVLNANRGGIATARAERDLARAAAEVAFERLAVELSIAQEALASVGARREAFESELIPALDVQDRELARLVELGEVDTLLLLESIRSGYEARRGLLELQLDETRARIELARLLGPDEPWEPAPVLQEDNATSDPEGDQ